MNRPASQNWVPDDPCQVTICRLIALSIVVHQRPDCCPQGDQARYQRLLQPLIVSSGMVTSFCTPPPPIIIKSFSDDVSWPGRDSSNSLIFLLKNIMANLMHMYMKKNHIVGRNLFDLPDLCDNIQPHHTKKHRQNYSFWHNIASIYSYMGLEDEAFSALLLIQDQIHFWNPFVRISIRLFII